MSQIKINSRSGFTIVEVLIVLAIAALILAIILIAVPDLQRSSRNRNIEQDARRVVAAIVNYEQNNLGNLPTSFVNGAGGVLAVGCNGGTCVNGSGHIQAGDTIGCGGPPCTTGVAVPATLAVGTLQVNYQELCGAATSANKSMAVYYPVEQASGAPLVGCAQA